MQNQTEECLRFGMMHNINGQYGSWSTIVAVNPILPIPKRWTELAWSGAGPLLSSYARSSS